MNSIGTKIAVVLLSIFMIAYVGYQAYSSLYKPYETETAAIGQYVQRVDLNGFFVRDEIVLNAKRTGVVSYNYRNAQKLPRNAVIANIYQSENDLYNLRRLEILQRQKEILEEAQDRENIDGMKLDLLNKQISANKLELVRCVDEGDFSTISPTEESLMLSIGKFNIFVDPQITYQASIDTISAQIETLKASIPAVKGTITSEESGYFANVVDGYEGVFTPEMLEGLTIEEVEEHLKAPQIKTLDNIGKLERDDRWYFVSLISTREAELFVSAYENQWPVQLKFNSESTRQVAAKIEQLLMEKDRNNAVVVFSSTCLDEDFAVMRFEKPQAVIADYTGIIISKEAVRVRKEKDEDGNEVNVKGVFVQVGDSVRFKKADVIYEDNYVLISQPNVREEYIANYDQVIIKGKDLHETAG